MELMKKMVIIKEAHVKNVQNLMDKYGVDYINANGEADAVCALYTLTGKADYCLSDDTDMFLYNTPKVLRNISLINHCVLEYDTEKILQELDMNIEDFRKVTILAGTDYNSTNFDLSEIMRYYDEYRESNLQDFYNFLILNKNIDIDLNKLSEIKKMYSLSLCNNVKKINISDRTVEYSDLFNLLELNGFLFHNRLENKLPWKTAIKVG